MNYPIDVDSTGYVDAVSELAGANRGVVDLMNTLTTSIYGGGGMAGTDTGSTAGAGRAPRGRLDASASGRATPTRAAWNNVRSLYPVRA